MSNNFSDSCSNKHDTPLPPLHVTTPPIRVVSDISPYVEVEFQGVRQRTLASEGANPLWNELLEFAFNPPGGNFAPAALRHLTTPVTLTVYDEVPVQHERRLGEPRYYK